ncbi:MAG: hypothetical protein QOJ39_166 [Candidatus Eremiobacteraeota bacterium]|jgi:hypothetical protein|nr:hypothetical protein [Candidatus Eremiobacteraeota bacterium]
MSVGNKNGTISPAAEAPRVALAWSDSPKENRR